MEKAENVAMIPLDVGWSDVGSWSALQDVLKSDDDGNTLEGDVLMHACTGSMVLAESRLVGVVGLNDVIVVETKDSVLVVNKQQSQDVKELVNQLKEEQRPETELHRQVFRPWGSYDSIENAEQFPGQAPDRETRRGAVFAEARASLRALGRRARQSEDYQERRGV